VRSSKPNGIVDVAIGIWESWRMKLIRDGGSACSCGEPERMKFPDATATARAAIGTCASLARRYATSSVVAHCRCPVPRHPSRCPVPSRARAVPRGREPPSALPCEKEPPPVPPREKEDRSLCASKRKLLVATSRRRPVHRPEPPPRCHATPRPRAVPPQLPCVVGRRERRRRGGTECRR
jgi:hypothetical protein